MVVYLVRLYNFNNNLALFNLSKSLVLEAF
jgi:hypothetical protein